MFRGQSIRFGLSFIFCIVSSVMLLLIFRNTFAGHSFFTFREIHGRRRIIGMVLFRGAFVNSFLYFISYLLLLTQRNQHAQVENEKLKHENLEARLYILKQQLSPHFLFNSLGILNTLTNDAVVNNYIVQLSHIYRYLLNNDNGHLGDLRSELDFINSYLYIVKERFEDALIVVMDIDKAELSKKLPPAALQLLIENAIKHNVVAFDDPLTITIATAGGYITVLNSINPRSSGIEGTGIGLHNISERYKLISKQEIIISKDALHFTVKLPLIP